MMYIRVYIVYRRVFMPHAVYIRGRRCRGLRCAAEPGEPSAEDHESSLLARSEPPEGPREQKRGSSPIVHYVTRTFTSYAPYRLYNYLVCTLVVHMLTLHSTYTVLIRAISESELVV